MDLDSASQISSMPASSQVNIPTELQYTNDFASNTGNRPITQPIKLTYYNEINFDHVAPGYAPCVDGKGQVNSWIWAHGWRLQQQDSVRPTYYWLCKICYKQRKHLAKPIKCSSGTTGVHNHLQRVAFYQSTWTTSPETTLWRCWRITSLNTLKNTFNAIIWSSHWYLYDDTFWSSWV